MKKLITVTLIFSLLSMIFAGTTASEATLEKSSAQEMTRLMKNGINLGNTMEATWKDYPGYDAADATIYETMWGQPVTTKEIFEGYKAAGFDSVRIPVAWTNTMDWRNGDFEINKNYMERVSQVVKYALDSDLYVVINDHWDNGWWGLFSTNEKLAWKIFDAIWDQVGTNFKDYSYKLIFEGGNEEIGERLNDTVDGKTGRLPAVKCYELANKINQHFVDKIRAQGGKNKNRFLLIPGYNTDIDKTCASAFKMPSDSSNSTCKLMISVHYYTPSTYCILSENASWGSCQSSWGTKTDVIYMNSQFEKMKKFTDAGYGVIIGEYAVAKMKSKRKFEKKENMELWLTGVLDNCDKYNYCPMLWDCNTFFKKDGWIGFVDDDVAAVFLNRE